MGEYKAGPMAKAHEPQPSPRMTWTSASETKALASPGCFHSWVAFWDSTGETQSVSLCPVASCDPQKPLGSHGFMLRGQAYKESDLSYRERL
jgi:hypothetical protein